MVKSITVKEVEYVAERLVRELSLDPYGRLPDILESCISEAFQLADNKFLHSDLISRACILFYLMIKKRPFEGGNKKIAVATLLAFLFANNKWLMVEPEVLCKFSKWIAESLPEFRREVVSATEKLLKRHTVDLRG